MEWVSQLGWLSQGHPSCIGLAEMKIWSPPIRAAIYSTLDTHTRFLYSGFDQQYGAAHNWQSFPDRAAHGGMDYIPWLLQQV